MLIMRPCEDSDEMAELRRAELDISRTRAAELGESAVSAIDAGEYATESGLVVDWSSQVHAAYINKVSIPPEDPLPEHDPPAFPESGGWSSTWKRCLAIGDWEVLGRSR